MEEAAVLIHERGVAGTTLDDVKAAAEVSGSQMYHYFPDKNDLVQAVIDYQADAIVSNHRHALGSANGVEAWRNIVITGARHTKAKGRCPLGSLGGQLAESDPEARALIAAGFDQWAQGTARRAGAERPATLHQAVAQVAQVFAPSGGCRSPWSVPHVPVACCRRPARRPCGRRAPRRT